MPVTSEDEPQYNATETMTWYVSQKRLDELDALSPTTQSTKKLEENDGD